MMCPLNQEYIANLARPTPIAIMMEYAPPKHGVQTLGLGADTYAVRNNKVAYGLLQPLLTVMSTMKVAAV